MLNNRQAGRRRGRGGQRPQGNSNNGRGPEQGNRIDNRARGNAPQLLEKYSGLARDAQMQGDRVLAEYYLQFADHYFRVVADNRARYEESRKPRDDGRDDWQDGEAANGDGGFADDGIGGPDDDGADEPRAQRRDGQNRDTQNRDTQNRDSQNRDNQYRDGGDRDTGLRNGANRDQRRGEYRAEPRRDARPPRDDARDGADHRSTAQADAADNAVVDADSQSATDMFGSADDATRARADDRTGARTRRPRRAVRSDDDAPVSNGLDPSLLPPAISIAEPAASDDDAPPPKPRRTRRKAEPEAEPEALAEG